VNSKFIKQAALAVVIIASLVYYTTSEKDEAVVIQIAEMNWASA